MGGRRKKSYYAGELFYRWARDGYRLTRLKTQLHGNTLISQLFKSRASTGTKKQYTNATGILLVEIYHTLIRQFGRDTML